MQENGEEKDARFGVRKGERRGGGARERERGTGERERGAREKGGVERDGSPAGLAVKELVAAANPTDAAPSAVEWFLRQVVVEKVAHVTKVLPKLVAAALPDARRGHGLPKLALVADHLGDCVPVVWGDVADKRPKGKISRPRQQTKCAKRRKECEGEGKSRGEKHDTKAG